MKSVILCEGKDDLWFISYFLNKTSSWIVDNDVKNTWKLYRVSKSEDRNVLYIRLENENKYAAVLAVGGKDSFKDKLKKILEINAQFPDDMIENIVLIRDCDTDQQSDILKEIASWFPGNIKLSNHKTSTYKMVVEEKERKVNFWPIIIPFNEEGALETVLLSAICEDGEEEAKIVKQAKNYVDEIKNECQKYLSHEREIVKAKFSATIAIINPDHSTSLFKDIMLDHSWEENKEVKKHYNFILSLIQ